MIVNDTLFEGCDVTVGLSIVYVCKHNDGHWYQPDEQLMRGVEEHIWTSLSHTLTTHRRESEPNELNTDDEKMLFRVLCEFNSNNRVIERVSLDPLTVTIRCLTTRSLHELYGLTLSSNLGDTLDDSLTTSTLREKTGITGLLLETKLCEQHFIDCQRKLSERGQSGSCQSLPQGTGRHVIKTAYSLCSIWG